MHPKVKKYKQFMELQESFTEECKSFEKDFRSFIKEVKQFQDTIHKWANDNAVILNELPTTEKQYTNSLVVIIKNGTELSNAMARLIEIDINYLTLYTTFEVKLKAMLSDRHPEVVVAELPKIKDFCKRNHQLLKGKIAEMKEERLIVEDLYHELKVSYNKTLN